MNTFFFFFFLLKISPAAYLFFWVVINLLTEPSENWGQVLTSQKKFNLDLDASLAT